MAILRKNSWGANSFGLLKKGPSLRNTAGTKEPSCRSLLPILRYRRVTILKETSHENTSEHYRYQQLGQKWYSPRATALMRLPIDSKALPQSWMANRTFPNRPRSSWSSLISIFWDPGNALRAKIVQRSRTRPTTKDEAELGGRLLNWRAWLV